MCTYWSVAVAMVIYYQTYRHIDNIFSISFYFTFYWIGTSDDKTILDMQDMRTYLKFKFKKTMKKTNYDKLSLEVLQTVVSRALKLHTLTPI